MGMVRFANLLLVNKCRCMCMHGMDLFPCGNVHQDKIDVRNLHFQEYLQRQYQSLVLHNYYRWWSWWMGTGFS